MRKIFSIAACIVISGTLYGQIKVATNGNVGINNTSPAYNLDVTGTVQFLYNANYIRFTGNQLIPSPGSVLLGYSSNMWAQIWATQAFFTYQPTIISDITVKSNIQDITGMNMKLKALRPVKYELISSVGNTDTTSYRKQQYGFIAQEIMNTFPEVVVPMGDKTYGIRYGELIPVLVQAMKEQQAEIENLKSELEALKMKIK